MSLIRRAIAGVERRSFDFSDTSPPPPGTIASEAGAGISELGALQIMAVYGSVSVIADALASLPWGLLSSTDPAKRRLLPLSQLLKKPYVEISRMDWLTQYASSMAMRGNFYGQVLERDQDFFPTQIKPIHPDRARVRRIPGTGQIEYRFNREIVKPDDVFHVRNLTVPGSLVGLNPIEYLRISLALARAQDLYGAAYFDNSANPEGVIEVEEELDEKETLALAKQWINAHQGPGKAHLPAVLAGGATWNPISVNPKDSQFLESRQYTATAISGMIFRVPPHMVGIVDRSTSWGTGIEQQERGFVTNTLGGYIGRLEEHLTELHPADRYVRFDLSKRLRGDKLQRYQSYALGTAGGWLCADDVRAAEDMPPLPDGMGQNFLIPINSELLAQALQSIQDQQDAATAAAALGAQSGGADA